MYLVTNYMTVTRLAKQIPERLASSQKFQKRRARFLRLLLNAEQNVIQFYICEGERIKQETKHEQHDFFLSHRRHLSITVQRPTRRRKERQLPVRSPQEAKCYMLGSPM